MFLIIGTFHLTIVTAWPKEQAHVIIVVKNTTLHISCILVTRPNLRMPRKSAQLVCVVVDKMAYVAVDAEVDMLSDTKVIVRSGSRIRGMGIEIII